jgi:hypothetical protein
MGVREAKYRIAKWKAKYETSSKGKRRKLRPETEEKIKIAFTKLVALENALKDILNETGVSTTMYVPYLSFGREINGLTRRHSGDELNKAIESVMAKWLGRKLDKAILEKIKKRVLGHRISKVKTV